MSVLSILKEHIKEHGPMTVATYMDICMYHPKHGYYMQKDPLGEDGDFITVPELTQMFGELIGLWVADCWIKLDRPEAFNLVEIGPGRGTLMSDALRAIEDVMPECHAALTTHLIEISPVLTKVQKKTLKKQKIEWHTSLDTLDLSQPTVIFANELLDALPVHQFVKEGTVYRERLVTLDDNNKLAFTQAAETTAFTADAPVIERAQAAWDYITMLKEKLQNGYLLLIDYGGSGAGDTLQAQKEHKMVSPLDYPGTSDLTTQVNFDDVRAILGETSSGPTDMSLFLMTLGLPVRAARLAEKAKNAEERKNIETVTKKLVDPNEMGRHFKVIGWRSSDTLPPPAGF